MEFGKIQIDGRYNYLAALDMEIFYFNSFSTLKSIIVNT